MPDFLFWQECDKMKREDFGNGRRNDHGNRKEGTGKRRRGRYFY